MRSLTAIGLLLILGAPPVLLRILADIGLNRIHLDVRAELLSGPQGSAVLRMAVPASCSRKPGFFRWFDEGEFECRGRMYDVVRRTETPDSLIFYVMEDPDETGFRETIRTWTIRLLENELVWDFLGFVWTQFWQVWPPPGPDLEPSAILCDGRSPAGDSVIQLRSLWKNGPLSPPPRT